MTPEIRAEVERTRLPERVVAGLMKAGLTVPHRDTVDRVGFSAREIGAIGVSPVDSDWDAVISKR